MPSLSDTFSALKDHSQRAPFFGDRGLFLSYAFQIPSLARLPLTLQHRPKIVQIEVTNRCNLDCTMCLRNTIQCERGDMPFPRFKAIIDRDFPHRHAALLYGQGEPFLNSDILRMIAYERERNNFVTTVTNATLLDQTTCENIVSSGLNVLRISLDAASPGVYGTIRRSGQFTDVLDNVMRIVRLIQQRRAGPRLCIVYMVMEDNLNDLPALVSLAHKLGISDIEVKEVPGYEIGGALSLSRMARHNDRILQEFLRIVSETRRMAQEKGLNIILPKLKLTGRRSLCLNPWFKTFITFSGLVTPCSRYFCREQYTCGDLSRQSLGEIWNNERYQNFRRAHRNGELSSENFHECVLSQS